MMVKGCECTIVLKTMNKVFSIPYFEETIRNNYILLHEEASIEGNGVCKAIQKNVGVTGCIVTPLSIKTVPFLLYLALGSAKEGEFLHVYKDLYKYRINLTPYELTESFDLIQNRDGSKRRYDNCGVDGFEMRFERENAVKLKMDIKGAIEVFEDPYEDTYPIESGERFNGDNVKYHVDGFEYTNIYGATVTVKKTGGTKTEILINRVISGKEYFLDELEKLEITGTLLKDRYENRHLGTFRITARELKLISDETNVNSAGAIMGQLRYYVSGVLFAEVFIPGEECII